MKVSSALVVCVFLMVEAAALPCGAQPLTRVRAMDERAGAAVERGLARSALFQRLVAELEASDLIVHVMTRLSQPERIVGTTRLSSPGAHQRYVRVIISADMAPEAQTAILGHELQHACEIARSRARDNADMRVLYQAIGERIESSREAYETIGAIDAGATVWTELHRSSQRTSAKTQEK